MSADQKEAVLYFTGGVVAIMVGQGLVARSNVYNQASVESIKAKVGARPTVSDPDSDGIVNP